MIDFFVGFNSGHALLLGPFVFYLCKSFWQYGGSTISELSNDKVIKLGVLFLLIIHSAILYLYGLEWFCRTTGFGASGSIITQLFPGVGYAYLCFSYVVSNRVFDNEKEERTEKKIKLLGGLLIILGYLSILNYRF